MLISVKAKGLTPLIMNRFGEVAEVAVSSGHSPVLTSSSDRGTPRNQAERVAYRDSKTGELYIPGPNLLSCLVEAGKFTKAGRTKLTTQKSTLVTAGLMVNEIVISLGTKDFEVDSRGVVIPATGGRIMRHRPRLDEWSFSFTLDVDESMFSESLVRTLVDDAGKKVGLGDFRPARKGPFGRFDVVSWEAKK